MFVIMSSSRTQAFWKSLDFDFASDMGFLCRAGSLDFSEVHESIEEKLKNYKNTCR